jgi:hypothetical protein
MFIIFKRFKKSIFSIFNDIFYTQNLYFKLKLLIQDYLKQVTVIYDE